jgi:hypothetical protein
LKIRVSDRVPLTRHFGPISNSAWNAAGETIDTDTLHFGWTTALLHSHRIQYVEMDVSFKVIGPRCFVVPLDVIGNCSVPLGSVVTPTEWAQSYPMLHDGLMKADPSLSPLLDNLPIVRDLGSGLTVFAGARLKHHFLRYRHVL